MWEGQTEWQGTIVFGILKEPLEGGHASGESGERELWAYSTQGAILFQETMHVRYFSSSSLILLDYLVL